MSSSYPPGAYGQQLVTCSGTKRYPGCRALFLAPSHSRKFCPACAGLDRARSFVFVQRRRQIEALRVEAEQEEVK